MRRTKEHTKIYIYIYIYIYRENNREERVKRLPDYVLYKKAVLVYVYIRRWIIILFYFLAIYI